MTMPSRPGWIASLGIALLSVLAAIVLLVALAWFVETFGLIGIGIMFLLVIVMALTLLIHGDMT